MLAFLIELLILNSAGNKIMTAKSQVEVEEVYYKPVSSRSILREEEKQSAPDVIFISKHNHCPSIRYF